ncbi:MAG TPA: acyltransferase, partial [Candidatus Limnocylindria bacterium]
MSTATAADGGAVVRADIQGLRAVAVGAVLLFHLWPNRLPGGYVGVDVFFVISGFLITSHLLHRPPRSGGDLLEFWSRRIRRLLPASLLVLTVITIATWAVAPEPQWGNAAKEIAASALYVVNWYLASSSVDYLAAENAPTAAQHFWSLSVEEQFYLVWPLLIGLLTVIALRRRWPLQTVVGAGLGLAVAASLAYSVIATAQVPASAYFVTPTRVWELGVGGLLALFLSRRAFGRVSESEAVPLPPVARALLAWMGLAAIALAAFLYSPATPFPGYTALLPVLGAAALVAAHAPSNAASPARYLAVRPMQWLGDVSYSVYLWHWPLIVLVPYVLGQPLRTTDKLLILVATLLLAGVTKILVED